MSFYYALSSMVAVMAIKETTTRHRISGMGLEPLSSKAAAQHLLSSPSDPSNKDPCDYISPFI